MAPLPNGEYYIKSVLTGHVLTISPDAVDRGALIFCSPQTASDSTAQMWNVELLSTSASNSSDKDQYMMYSVFPRRYAYYGQRKSEAVALARTTAVCPWVIRSAKGYYSIGIPHDTRVLSCKAEGQQKLVLTPLKGIPSPEQQWEFSESSSEDTDNQEKSMNDISDLIEKFRADPISNTKLWKVLETLRHGGDERYDEAISVVNERSIVPVNDLTSNRMKVLVLNLEGLKALKREDFSTAVEWFTKAITLDGKCSTSHANRSEAYAVNGKLEAALTDAEKSITLDPTFGLGYHRKGDVLDRLWNSNDRESVQLRDKLKTQTPPKVANDPQPTMPTNVHAPRTTPPPTNVHADRTIPPPTNSHPNPTMLARSNVFFTIRIGDDNAGRIVFKLFDDWAPYSSQTFRELAAGIHGFGYKGSLFDLTMRERCFGGDDIGGANGGQGVSIFNPPRAVEKHNHLGFTPGLLYLGTKTKFINSRFVISVVAPAPLLKYGSPIGQVVEGVGVVKQICATDKDVKIVDSGCMP